MPAEKTQWEGLVAVEPAKPESGCSAVFRSSYAPTGHSSLGSKTLVEMFERSVKLYGPRPCLGHRPIVDGVTQPFQFLSYNEVAETVNHVGSGYTNLGLKPKDKIGVIGPNTPEWMMAMQAINRMDMVCVPLYDTLGDEAVQYIIRHSEAKLIISAASKLQGLIKTLPKVKGVVTAGIVYWGDAPQETVQALKDQGLSVVSWQDLVEGGKAKPQEPGTRPEPEDLCTIMYTSGTTGDPKGVAISHRAVLATIAGVIDHVDNTWEKFTSDDVYLSYLPLAHIFDRVVEEMLLYVGGSIGYFQGDIRKLVDDIGALRPTIFAGVPRVFERIYNGVMDQVHKGGILKQAVFNWAYGRKLHFLNEGWRFDRASIVSDLLVFNQVKQRLGGRVRVIVSGGAPLSPAIEEFLRVAMCCPVVQGYGLTETCAASCIGCPHNAKQVGTVGPPMSQTEFRLEAVPEMGYSPSADPPAGEVCIRGPGIFTEYYKNKEMTKEAMDADGFFHTGDVGIIVEGALKIIDRKKNIFKLSHGEYIAVERLEASFKQCPLVEQIWIYGNSMESSLVAVVVPKASVAEQWAQENNTAFNFKELCSNAAFNAHVLTQLKATGKAERLKGFEVIHAVHLEHEQFSIDNDLMTPKFSLKRNQLLKKYQKVINDMYAQLKKASSQQAS